MGFRIVRFTNEEVIEDVDSVIRRRGWVRRRPGDAKGKGRSGRRGRIRRGRPDGHDWSGKKKELGKYAQEAHTAGEGKGKAEETCRRLYNSSEQSTVS
jgi:hypothetical protein